MKIALIGYGKMGKTIEKIAMERGHSISYKIDILNRHELGELSPENTDVAIEFSRPEAAFENVTAAIRGNVPVIVGTTGWLKDLEKAKRLCRKQGSAMMYASNYSVGVNLFFALNRVLAKMMQSQPQYNVLMEEIHHTEKLDAPSGTAITLANDILKLLSHKENWVLGEKYDADEIPIVAKRFDKVPGTHTIVYDSPIDTIEIKHTAHTREGFALGAVMSAEWIVGKKGVFGMKDMLGF
jgi:4-hydroxy-tetrahydrodipicolinate reductase